ncbi:hypothetical protein WEB32_02900 [Streptomyces netropsis]|uniref:Succinate-acetate transporter protein n=1 Tax=Streptomyces netropsis TaxID=55404 RepID=A0A7W7LGB2_STRNE|nr:hypothetical protein [Streptomyces netropsis]MBB4889081.1 succinate-acetate transporter protein [Streptomyces netropsis]GGR08085.1 hypothetical protein GCM10010219_10410 [Streptomyces netropsis]
MTTHAGGTSTATRDSGNGLVSGWTAFAAILMVFGGLMAIFQGISAIAKDNVFVVTREYAFQFNLTGWGWIHLILGIVIMLAGFALFKGAMWARVVGVVLAGLGMIANFMWLPYYPLWALVLLALDVFVIWALCAAPRHTT